MFSGNSCDAPWARLSPGRELANLLENILQAGLSEACPDRSAELDSGGVKDGIAAQLDAGRLAELANACHKQIARLQVLELAALAEYRRRRRADDCWEPHLSSEIDRFITQELSAATATSPASLDVSLTVGRDLEDRLPDVREAMLTGGADFAKAKAIGELTRLIKDPDILDAAQQRAVEWARNTTSTRLRHNLRKLVKRLAPDAVAERKKRSVAMRSLQVWDNDDETATLAGVNLDPALAERAYDRINELAKARRNAGDERTLDNLRADTLIGLIFGDTPPDPGSSGPGGGPPGGPGGNPDDSSGERPQDSPGADPHDGTDAARDRCPHDGPGQEPDEDPAGSQEGGADNEPDFQAGHGPQAGPGGSDPAMAPDASADPKTGHGPDGEADTRTRQGTETGTGTSTRAGSETSAEANAAGAGAALRAAERAARVLAGLKPGTDAAAIAAHALRLRDQAGQFPGCVTAELPDGTTIHGNPTYRPPGSMQWNIEQRDRTCRYPNCNRKAVGCDIDHGIPYNRDGPTCPCNLHSVCRGHHRQKQLPGWHLIDLHPGVTCWVAPTGHWYITTPGIEAD